MRHLVTALTDAALTFPYRRRLEALVEDVSARSIGVLHALTAPVVKTTGSSLGSLDPESAAWLAAHTHAAPQDTPAGTALVHADDNVQKWMGETLQLLGWDVNEPVLVSEGWVPARGEHTDTGQPYTTYTSPSKTKAFARNSDPTTSKEAGAHAVSRNAVTVASQQGKLLLAYCARHNDRPGQGYTAAEAVAAANLHTDGITGSPWHRVTDLRDMALLTYRLDATGTRTTRKNESKSDADVLVITPLGIRACAVLNRLADAGLYDQPLLFDGPTDDALFEDLGQTLARVTDEAP